ncbi:MAG: HEAT repeat domain-containing protein [Planctomycetota bacterium]|nr:HEAT repeat domain-containing protein [Planctomycetota bacterium]
MISGWILSLLLLTGQVQQPASDIARLRELLADKKQPQLQAQAAYLILNQQTPLATETVKQYLRDPRNVEVFTAFAGAIKLRRDGRFSEELIEALSIELPAVRQAAVEALGASVDGKATFKLKQIAENNRSEDNIRQQAIIALGKTGKKNAAETLLKLFIDPKESIRQTSRQALAELIGEDLGRDSVTWQLWFDERKNLSVEVWLEERLAQRNAKLTRLEGELDSSRNRNRTLYQQLYSRLGPTEKIPFFQGLLDHEDPAVRLLLTGWLAEALGEESYRKPAGEMLLSFSRDPIEEVRRQAVLGLGRWNDKACLNRLLLIIQSDQTAVRAAAARSLAMQAKGNDGAARMVLVLPALQNALSDPALEVVVEAAEDLGSLGVPAAVPLLAGLLKHKEVAVRKTAAQALERIADIAVLEELLAGLEDLDVGVRLGILGAVSRAVNQAKAIKEDDKLRLQSRMEIILLKDPDAGVRARSATLLGEFGTVSHLATLWKAAVSEGDPRIQEKSWQAFLEILSKSKNLKLINEWNVIVRKDAPLRRVNFLVELLGKMQPATMNPKIELAPVRELLVQCGIENQKWLPAWSALRELPQALEPEEIEKRLSLLFQIAEIALKEQAAPDVLQMVDFARPLFVGRKKLQADFEELYRKANALINSKS